MTSTTRLSRALMLLRKTTTNKMTKKTRRALLTWSTIKNFLHNETIFSFKRVMIVRTVSWRTVPCPESQNVKASTLHPRIPQFKSHRASIQMKSPQKPLKNPKTSFFPMSWKNTSSRFTLKISSRKSLLKSNPLKTRPKCSLKIKSFWKSFQIGLKILKNLTTCSSKALSTKEFYTCWIQNTQTATTKTELSHRCLDKNLHQPLIKELQTRKVTSTPSKELHKNQPNHSPEKSLNLTGLIRNKITHDKVHA